MFFSQLRKNRYGLIWPRTNLVAVTEVTKDEHKKNYAILLDGLHEPARASVTNSIQDIK